MSAYNPTQLRDSAKTVADSKYSVMNFGESKGLTFERTLIYPTKPILDWIKDNSKELSPTSRSKFYVGITRAKYSVGILLNNDSNLTIDGINNRVG